MNIKALELQAKALTPIFKEHIAKALDVRDDRLREELAAELKSLKEAIEQKGKDADYEAIALMAAELIDPPKDGEKGEDGQSVSLDDVKEFLSSKFSDWALEFERQGHDVVQRSIDRMPRPKDGTDGVGWQDMDVEHDGAGNVTFKFERDGNVKEFTIRLPVVIDCGVFKDGEEYSKGNGVTLGGSFYIAQVDSPEGRPNASKDWRLAVKKGRDAPREPRK